VSERKVRFSNKINIKTTRSENNNLKKKEGKEAEGRRAEGRLTSSVFLILKYSSLTANLFFNDKKRVFVQTLIKDDRQSIH